MNVCTYECESKSDRLVFSCFCIWDTRGGERWWMVVLHRYLSLQRARAMGMVQPSRIMIKHFVGQVKEKILLCLRRCGCDGVA